MNATSLVTVAGERELLDRVRYSADNPPRFGGVGFVVGRLGPADDLKSCLLAPLPPDAGRRGDDSRSRGDGRSAG